MNQVNGLILAVFVQALFVAGEVFQWTENSCKKQVSSQELQWVCNKVPYTVTKTEWCADILKFFRCKKKRTEYRTECQDEYVTKWKTVWECCSGYAQSGYQCIPLCDPECVHGICEQPDQCACEPGFRGQTCGGQCKYGKYGMDCALTCECTSDLSFCHHIEGCISSERYYQLFPREARENIQSNCGTSSMGITWIGIGIATVVLLVLVLALVVYFRPKTKKGMTRVVPPGYPVKTGFINPTFSNGDETDTAPYEQPPQYEDIVYEDKKQQQERPQELSMDRRVNTSIQGKLSREPITLNHVYGHTEEEEERRAANPSDVKVPSKIQLTVVNEYAHLDGADLESRDPAPNDTNSITHQNKPKPESHTYSSLSKHPEPENESENEPEENLYGGSGHSGYANSPTEYVDSSLRK